MLSFILSKFNLLILATGLFVIVSYFAFGFRGTVESALAFQQASSITANASMLLSAGTLCGATDVQLPKTLSPYNVLGFSYKVKLRGFKYKEKSLLIAEILQRNKYLNLGNPIVLASSRRDINADIKFFSYEEGELCPSDETVLDPRGAPYPMDEFLFVKEIYKGHTYFYVVPCSSYHRKLCEANLYRLGCYLYKKRGDVESNCVPVDEDSCKTASSFPSCWGAIP
ncbi:MAG: hypothetical protein J7J87_00070 [Candidatus Diapherotrites archaeon]|nr:hypothetical protein [Candidatus Diapherotrites archaeon]